MDDVKVEIFEETEKLKTVSSTKKNSKLTSKKIKSSRNLIWLVKGYIPFPQKQTFLHQLNSAVSKIS